MSDIGTDSLPEDVAKLLGSAKELRGPSDAVRASMRARLVAALPPGGGGGGGSPAPPKAAGFPRVPAWVAAATFAAGIAAGVAIRPTPAPAPPVVVAKTTDVAKTAPSVAAAPAAPTLVPDDLPLVATVKTAPSNAPTAAASHGGASDLAAERAVLDMARTALGRGDPENALAATAQHEKRFPRGALAEEREAIAVRALSEGGRKPEAKARAERFKKSHPDSILLPAVLAAGGVP